MKPRPFTILLLLLAGAVVTILIPEVVPFLIFSRIDPGWLERDTAEVCTLAEEHWPDGWPEPNGFDTQHGNLLTTHSVHVVANGTTTHMLHESVWGWPYRGKRSRNYWDGSRERSWSIWRGDLRCILPLGFTLNTFFYAALLWLLFFGPVTLRRDLRARRGLCRACAYPVGESAVCSECGRAVGKTTT